MYYIYNIKISSRKAKIEMIDTLTFETFYLREVRREKGILILKPTVSLKLDALQPLEEEIKDIVKGGWNAKLVKISY